MIRIEKIEDDIAIIAFDDITLNVNRSILPENAQEGAELNLIIIPQSEPIEEEVVEEIPEVEEEIKVEESE
jgi:hypothetical protein